MKFSYTLLKKLVPQIKSKSDLIARLNLHVFEAEDGRGDTIEIVVSPNRYSSAAGHWGMAQEISAVYRGKFQFLISNFQFLKKGKANFQVKVETDLCHRIAAQYIDSVRIKPSPKWLQKILLDCGMRPINNIVDITNYVMLETGQPLHAFDYDLVAGGELIVRHARHAETLITLDGKEFRLDPSMIVIADTKEPLDIAGIKGGKKSEINSRTTRILLTAANFDGASIYKTSRALGLITDASVRNTHNLSPVLPAVGLTRGAEMMADLASGVLGAVVDVQQRKISRRVLKFDVDRFNNISGLSLKAREAYAHLQRLGFGVVKDGKIEIPPTRDDVERFEDLVEEVVRLVGYDNVPAMPPHTALRPSGSEDQITLKERARYLLTHAGLDEVYNYSFISQKELEQTAGEFFGMQAAPLTNPISADFAYLRPSLAIGLMKNIESNFRFMDEVRVFEIGHVFLPEKVLLGVTLASKKNKTIFELKGVVESLLEGLGIADYHYADLNFELPFLNGRESLRVEVDHHVVGYVGVIKGSGGRQSIAEIDLEKLLTLAIAERTYEEISPYPTVIRDISVLVPRHIRVSELMNSINGAGVQLLDDVDMIDSYEDEKSLGENIQSITFRLVFLSKERTLTDKEVDEELAKITGALVTHHGAEIK